VTIPPDRPGTERVETPVSICSINQPSSSFSSTTIIIIIIIIINRFYYVSPERTLHFKAPPCTSGRPPL